MLSTFEKLLLGCLWWFSFLREEEGREGFERDVYFRIFRGGEVGMRSSRVQVSRITWIFKEGEMNLLENKREKEKMELEVIGFFRVGLIYFIGDIFRPGNISPTMCIYTARWYYRYNTFIGAYFIVGLVFIHIIIEGEFSRHIYSPLKRNNEKNNTILSCRVYIIIIVIIIIIIIIVVFNRIKSRILLKVEISFVNEWTFCLVI